MKRIIDQDINYHCWSYCYYFNCVVHYLLLLIVDIVDCCCLLPITVCCNVWLLIVVCFLLLVLFVGAVSFVLLLTAKIELIVVVDCFWPMILCCWIVVFRFLRPRSKKSKTRARRVGGNLRDEPKDPRPGGDEPSRATTSWCDRRNFLFVQPKDHLSWWLMHVSQ